MNQRRQLGFGLGLRNTYSDLAIPLGIIVILALIAVYKYQDFLAQARVSEGIASVARAQAAVEKAFAAHGPADMALRVATGWAPSATEHLQTVAIGNNGTITLQFAETVAPQGENVIQIVPVFAGQALDLSQAAGSGRKFEWQCGGPAGKTTMPEKYRPEHCR